MVYYKDISSESVQTLLDLYSMQIACVSSGQNIPHSFWGAPEAGRQQNCLYIRGDTPIHSILHEACHYICMPKDRRELTQVDAKGSAMEENATCYLQILISDHLQDYNRSQLMRDMDDWGYNFRLGSAQNWFTKDAEDAQQWLIHQNIINNDNQPTWKLRK